MILKLLAKWWAKKTYLWKLYMEASANDINSALSLRRAQDKRKFVEQVNAEVKAIEDHIAHEKEMIDKGFWECEDGHAMEGPSPEEIEEKKIHVTGCAECGKPIKYVKWSSLTPKEQYDMESDRKDALKVVEGKKQLATQEAGNAKGGEDMSAKFKRDAENSRQVAQKIREL